MADYVFAKAYATKWTGANGAAIASMCTTASAIIDGTTWSVGSEGATLGLVQTPAGGGTPGTWTVTSAKPWVVMLHDYSGIFARQSDAEFSGQFLKLSDLAAQPGWPVAARSFTNNVTRSTTTSTGASGFQVSATRDAEVGYNLTTSTTATIAAAASITVLLEIAATNSATAGDWQEIARIANGQTITLAVTLQSVQTLGGRLTGVIPAGYYAKIRTVASGTASATYITGQEVLL